MRTYNTIKFTVFYKLLGNAPIATKGVEDGAINNGGFRRSLDSFIVGIISS
jgi:hypothetical protein